MVAGCPKCSARYKVDANRIGPEGAKLRCTKCSAVFLVRAPRPAAGATGREADGATTSSGAKATAQAVDDNADPRRLVVVADSDDARGKATAEAVRGWGLVPLLVSDGVEAMLAIQRRLPRTVILDAALPKMFGFQVCEVVKRNESLRETLVVLIGAIHDQDRYRRNPSDLYGADAYVESPDVPEGLEPVLRGERGPLAGGGTAAAPSAPTAAEPSAAPATEPAAPTPAPTIVPPEPKTATAPPAAAEPALELDPEPTVAPPTPAPAPASDATPTAGDDPEHAAERERAQRLARIAVSEMVLYQPEKFDKASREGNLEQALDLEIQEARALLRQRISEAVRNETDFVLEELNRVAQERGGQA
jgi:predicted Zn finger-like uncharacterized protein